jgi:predicted transcriptional regulator
MPTNAAHGPASATDALTKLLPDAEAEIMHLVWQQQCTTVKQIHRIRAQQCDLAYTTTVTTMERLVKTGLLHRRREGLAYVYTPALSESEFVAQRLADILNSVDCAYPAALTAYLARRCASAIA